MRAITTGILVAGLFAGAAAGSPETETPKSVCLYTPRINYTKTVDSRTLLFYMKDGKIWKNTLRNSCSGLKFHGFAYRTHDQQLCSNQQVIHVLETGEVCMLGPFTPQEKAPAKT